MFIILALLSGWLVTELKDFMTLGGVSNLLAFGLLKICFIMFLIAIVIGGIIFPEVVLEALRRMKEKIPKEQNIQPFQFPNPNHRGDNNHHRRNNSG